MPRDAASLPTQPAEKNQCAAYSREQVRRLLKIPERLLRSWERQQLVPERNEYKFSDLLLLKAIARLREERIPAQRIRRSLLALRERLKDTPDLFSQVRVSAHGHRVRVQVGKQQMDPISGQLLFDFDANEISKLLQLPRVGGGAEKAAELLKRRMEADGWFERGLELEQNGAPIEQVIYAYERAAELDPTAAGARVNLGTIYFHGHAWSDAEAQYKKALEIDPNYPLAQFNLGNLYDEQGDYANALAHYNAAIRLFPKYADAHYNLALLYQNAGRMMEAVRHWRAYLKLDRTSSWSDIARRELARIEAVTVVEGSRSGGTEYRLEAYDS
ncbi:MAG: tetratricopeptide repeat protein [Bryobacteraceae bacterium]